MPCRVCGRVWRKRRRFAFWRNRPTWRRRRALAIGRAHSLYSHPGWLETAHQTAHMCFSVINSTMTPSRRRAQDCPRPLVLPHGCVCPPAFHERAPGAGCGSSAQTDRGHDRLPSACPCCACRLMHGRESGSVRWPAAAALVSHTMKSGRTNTRMRQHERPRAVLCAAATRSHRGSDHAEAHVCCLMRSFQPARVAIEAVGTTNC